MLDKIKQNMKSCTDWYADNAEFLDDMEWMVAEIERLSVELDKTNLNHKRLQAYTEGLENGVPSLDEIGALKEKMKNGNVSFPENFNW